MEPNNKLKTGKLPDDFLENILRKYTHVNDSRVLLGPKLGEDAAIIDMGCVSDNCLAVCVDPIMVNIKHAPYFAVAININDIVTRGAVPKWASSSIFFPEGSTMDDVESFFNQLYEAARPYKISLVTGHTEITSAVKNPGIVLTMLGEVQRNDIITTSGAQEGDVIILTGGAGIEGTLILATDFYHLLKCKIREDLIEKAQRYIFEPGICIADAAYIAWKYKPNSLHDPTEGGIRKGIEEMAIASKKGVIIDYSKIPIRKETHEICKVTGDDPLGIFASGALLISLPSDRARVLLHEYKNKGINAEEIGRVTSERYGRIILYGNKELPLEASYTDGLINRLN